MKSIGKLPPQEWLTLPHTKQLIAALTQNGATVRFVGGCVRDSLLGIEVGDLDLAIDRNPDHVMALLEQANIKSIPIGFSHGSVMAVIEGETFEITTLRVDIETYGRHAKVGFTDDWEADAARRDFTMNALYADLDGTIYDPCKGMEDLKAGRVKFIGDPVTRIEEDALRILRFFRIYAYFGKGSPDSKSLMACGEKSQLLNALSGERVTQEMFKLLGSPKPIPALKVAHIQGVLRQLMGNENEFPEGNLNALIKAEQTINPLNRLVVLVAGDEDIIEGIIKKWKLSNQQKNELRFLSVHYRSFPTNTVPELRRQWLYEFGITDFKNLIALNAAKSLINGKELTEIYKSADKWMKPRFPLTGDDLQALGFEPGPELGKALKKVEQWWVSENFKPNKIACLEYIKEQ